MSKLLTIKRFDRISFEQASEHACTVSLGAGAERVNIDLVPGIEIEGFRIGVNTRDERGHKPHAHVIKDREKCKIILDDSLEPYDICMSRKSVGRARELVGNNFGKLLRLW